MRTLGLESAVKIRPFEYRVQKSVKYHFPKIISKFSAFLNIVNVWEVLASDFNLFDYVMFDYA